MLTGRSESGERALSPVIGTSLLIAIAVVLVTVSAAMILGMTDETPPAPTSDLRLEPTGGNEYTLEMKSGDPIDGNRIQIHGIKDPQALQGEDLVAGDSIRVEPTSETVTITWHEEGDNGVSYTLHTFDVDLTNMFPDGIVMTTNSDGDIIEVVGDGGEVQTLVDSGNVEAIGDADQDVTGDGEPDVPFVTGNQEIKVTNPDGDVTELLNGSDGLSDDIYYEKTRLAIGRWNGSDPSVFFVNQNNDAIYRVSSSGSPVQVAAPDDGAQSVVGVGDIDDDGTDELIFGDASQTLQYIESDGSVETTTVTTGSNNGIGTGTLADFDGDGQARVAVVDGSNYIQLVDSSGGTTISTNEAKKAPTAAADVDDDNNPEIVYIDDSDGKIYYIDNVGGANKKKALRDEKGDKIDGSATTGTA